MKRRTAASFLFALGEKRTREKRRRGALERRRRSEIRPAGVDPHHVGTHRRHPLPRHVVGTSLERGEHDAQHPGPLRPAAVISEPGAERLVRYGRPVETLLREATTWQADLLVVGSHGRGWAERVLVGSVTERLLNHLPTSLVVVPVGATNGDD